MAQRPIVMETQVVDARVVKAKVLPQSRRPELYTRLA